MGFFNKINNSLDVNALEQFSKRRDGIILFTSFLKVGTTNIMCCTYPGARRSVTFGEELVERDGLVVLVGRGRKSEAQVGVT